MFFKWSPDLDTGIAEIDTQHRTLADLINSLNDARHGADSSQIGDVLNALADYTINHFSFEEQLMEEAGYPHLRAHQRIHQLFINRITEYRERFDNGENVTDDLLTLLKGWLASHIQQEDRGYLSSVSVVTEDTSKSSWVSGLVSKLFG